MTSFTFTEFALKEEKSESCSVISDSLWPHELFSPWNSPDKTNGVGSLALLQGVFPNLGSNPGLLHCRQSFYQLSHKGNPRILEWIPVPSPADLPNPGIKLGSSALQVDSLWTELWRKPYPLLSHYTEGGCGDEPSGIWQRSWGIKAPWIPYNMELPCQPSIYIWTYKRKIDCSFVFMSIFLVIFCNLKIYSQFWKYLGTEST